jgi:hypothetical protein
MPGTTYQRVLVGTTSSPIPVTPTTVVNAAPLAQGGTILIEFSQDGRTRWLPVLSTVNTMGQLFRTDQNGYIRITAGVSHAAVHIVDISGSNGPYVTQLALCVAPVTCASATTEQILFGMRFPKGYLPAVFNLVFALSFNFVNSATVKTVRVRWGLPGASIGGTAMYVSPSLASTLNHNMVGQIIGRGDGRSLIGTSAGASGGIGNSTTAFPTLDIDYLNQETELSVTVTKATAGDAFFMDSGIFKLY